MTLDISVWSYYNIVTVTMTICIYTLFAFLFIVGIHSYDCIQSLDWTGPNY